MTACSAVIECKHKMAFVNTLPIEKLLLWLAACAFHFCFCSHLYFDLSIVYFFFYVRLNSEPLVGCCHQQMIQGPLDPWQEKKKHTHLQAVNELPSMPSVKGVYKLTDFCRGYPLALSFHFLSLCAPPSCPSSFSSLPACFTLWQLWEQLCLAQALHRQHGSCSELAI